MHTKHQDEKTSRHRFGAYVDSRTGSVDGQSRGNSVQRSGSQSSDMDDGLDVGVAADVSGQHSIKDTKSM